MSLKFGMCKNKEMGLSEFSKVFHFEYTDDGTGMRIVKLRSTIDKSVSKNLIVPSSIYNWQVYLPDDCSELFVGSPFKNIDLSNIIDKTNVINSDYMFFECRNLRTVNISGFTNIKSAKAMFGNCVKLKKVIMTDMSSCNTDMFINCRSLVSCSSTEES